MSGCRDDSAVIDSVDDAIDIRDEFIDSRVEIKEELLDESKNKLEPNRIDEGTIKNQTGQKPGLCNTIEKIKNDSLYRQRIVHTAILFWSFVGLGWVVGMTGPVFPDLRQMMHEDLASSSWMFTAGSLGYLTGSLLGGFMYDKLNKVLLLAVSSLGMGLSMLLTPYCSTLPTMLFIKFCGGLFCGGLDTGGNADIIFVWGSDVDSYMQTLHFGFSLGALLSPLVTEPFLARKVSVCNNTYMTSSNIGLPVAHAQTTKPVLDVAISEEFQNISSEHLNTTITTCTEYFEDTNVHFAFLISAIIAFTSTVGYVYLFLKIRHNNQAMKPSHLDITAKANDKIKQRKNMSNCLKGTVLVLLALLIASYCIVEDSFASFLMTFSLDYLHWNKSTGSFATAVFWLSFGIGRFSGIFIVSYCRNSTLLTSYLLMLCFGYIGFLIATQLTVYPLIWVFIIVLGFSMSVIFPAIFSWTSEHVTHVSGKISSLYLTSASLAGMSFPLLIGNLMEHYHPMWFVYILVIMMVMCLLIYLCIRILVKYYSKVNIEGNKGDDIREGTELTMIK